MFEGEAPPVSRARRLRPWDRHETTRPFLHTAMLPLAHQSTAAAVIEFLLWIDTAHKGRAVSGLFLY